MKSLHRSFVFLLMFLGSITCFAQTRNKDLAHEKGKQIKFAARIDVKANLSVLDAANQPVGDIKVEDVKIFEDGVEQKITYFIKKEPVLNFGLVVDNTGSMRENLKKVTKASSALLDNLRPGDDFFVVRFVDSNKVEAIQDWTSDKKDMTEALDNMFIEGGQSAVLDAVYLSAEKLLERERKDKSKRYALILISDAEERDSYYSFDETMKHFKETDLQIFLVSFAEGAPQQKPEARLYSHLLTLKTGGTLFSLPKKNKMEDIVAALKNIMAELRAPYVVGYTSTNQKWDGLPRKLTVQIADSAKGEKRQGAIREGFVVPKI